MRPVHHVHDDVGVADLLERRAERLHELVRQVADEPDGVGEGVDASVGGLRPADRRIQSREQRVLHEHTRAGEPVEERSEEHTSELQSLMRISYAVFCLKKKQSQNTRPPSKIKT